MAHWLYIALATPSSSNSIGSGYKTGYTTVTGFPIYTSDKELILTEENPGTSIGIMRYYEYDNAPNYSDYHSGISVNSLPIIEGRIDDSILYDSTWVSYAQVSPCKLFRVETETSVDQYCTRYEDAQIKGRYLIRDIPNFLFNGFIIPVKYLHKGEIKDGIGNYDTTNFTFLPTRAWSRGGGSTVESYAARTRSYIANASAMTPKAIKRQEAYSNKLVLSDISVGDIIDFGPDYQHVPSILKTWLDNSCENITDSVEPAVFEMTTTAGIRLFTAETYSYWDMKVVPKLEEREIHEDGEYTVNSGFAGISKVTVDVRSARNIPEFEWTLRKTLDFSMIPENLLGAIHFVYFDLPDAESKPFIGLRISDGVVTAIQYDDYPNEFTLYDANGWIDPKYQKVHCANAAVSGLLYTFLNHNYVLWISFSIGGTTVTAEEGTTLAEWFESQGLSETVTVTDTEIMDTTNGAYLYYDGTKVGGTHVIVDGGVYTWISPPTETTYNIPSGWVASAGYGIFNVSGDINGSSFTTLAIGYVDSVSYRNCISLFTNSSFSSQFGNSSSLTITITGGDDVDNELLKSWLDTYGE